MAWSRLLLRMTAMAVLLATSDYAAAQAVARGVAAPMSADAVDVPPGAFEAGHITFSTFEFSPGKPASRAMAVIKIGGQASLASQLPAGHCATEAMRGPSPGLQFEGPVGLALARLVTAINHKTWNDALGMLPAKTPDGHVFRSNVTIYPGRGAAIDDLASLLAQLEGVGLNIEMANDEPMQSCNLILFASDGYTTTYWLRPNERRW